MTQLPSDKFNVAWFKLAEFVTRKEKERALHIYRLLVHSLPDEAFAQQLEGDLLWSFNDAKAVECYIKAAALYEKRADFIQAAAVYEHILSIAPRVPEYVLKAILIYEQLNNREKITQLLSSLLDTVMDKPDLAPVLTKISSVSDQLHEQAIDYIKNKK